MNERAHHSAMATTTSLQLHGGIGILHSNFKDGQQQADEVMKVKRFKQGFIAHPAALKPTDTVRDLLDLKASLRDDPDNQAAPQ